MFRLMKKYVCEKKSNFNFFKKGPFIQGLGAEAPVNGVETKSPTETWIGYGGPSPPMTEKLVTNCFLIRFWLQFHSRIFHDTKHFLNFLYISKKKNRNSVYFMILKF